ncbi:MAG: sulfotransferase domain-containing protein [Owenweeksia sp.]|nr:sulfotransferase domain-containing protein [Owenweeksia sp.]
MILRYPTNIWQRSGFHFMKEHEDKFGMRKPMAQKTYDQFIRQGKSGSWREYFSRAQQQRFADDFNDQLARYFWC